ncbi:MAG TPA: glycogen synthase GlgA [Clostridiaceae bacterium]|nr:glycogen synthase GlgA [Clostridiaceae bacterium]
MVKVLMASSEAAPFAKTGGLGDVAGSLPKYIIKNDVDIRVIMPLYKTIPQSLKKNIFYKTNFFVNLGWRRQHCGIYECIYNGVRFYFIDNEYYFGRDRIYGYMDDSECFAYFCRAVLEALPYLDFIPDIIHCNDWQTGMIPVLLKAKYCSIGLYKKIHTLFTIHNLKYQGIFPKSILGDILELGDEYFTYDKLEFYGSVSFMKGALVYSDIINTVSPTYAYEIQYPYMGERLDGLLNARKKDLYGILNGLDYDEYNPETDKNIFANYDENNIAGKTADKLKLQEYSGLDVSADKPVIGIVSRLAYSKGLDLVINVFERLMDLDVQLVVLGVGDEAYEDFFKGASLKYKGKVSANIVFDNALAHKIYAGSDMFLMPSYFEPCGLGQIIALRYGSIPIVRETGGLVDTVLSYNEFTNEGNGFSFTNFNADDMLYTIKRALGFYHEKKIWNEIMRRAMGCDFSWDKSASIYVELYNKLISFN